MPRMARADDIWAQAWSEPESGSDLASLRSTATRTDGGWLLNGQKTWSSRASFADWGFGLFRSDPDAQRHKGITYFMFDLRSPGVTVRPIDQLDGEPGFAEIFLEDVFVPDDPANPGESGVIGGVNEGWRVAMSTASNERGLSLRSPGRFLATADRLHPWYYSDAPASVREQLVAARRVSTFDEVVQGLDEDTALFEARRCLSCGNCFACDNCYGVCPDNAVIKLDEGGPYAYEIDLDFCKGCGLCAAECPCGAIEMTPERI